MKTGRLMLTSTAAALCLTAGMAMSETVVTMNTVQIFGSIDPAKISDYTDYMAAVNLYDALVTVDSWASWCPNWPKAGRSRMMRAK